MKYQVEKQDPGVSIQIEDVAGQEQEFLEAIRSCRQGAWACQSGECVNIGEMAERVDDGRVFLTLTPKPGAHIDPAGIEVCLRYMLGSREKLTGE